MSIEDMKLAFDKAVNMAYMQKRPMVVVEGKDDLSIYMRIANEIKDNITVRPIQYYKNCSAGCNQIEKEFKKLNDQYSNDHEVYKYTLGVMDRDAKGFRGELKAYTGIYYLDFYSLENCFVSLKSLLHVFAYLTHVTPDILDDKLCSYILEKINYSKDNFYYATLEALKNAVDSSYDALIGFSGGYEESLKNPNLNKKLVEKSADLDAFAMDINIQNECILNFGNFCKGKWHLKYFLNEIKRIADDSFRDCGKSLAQCTYCEIDDKKNCLYRVKTKPDVNQITNVVKDKLENGEFTKVSHRMSLLAS
jgi:hypothetical protein